MKIKKFTLLKASKIFVADIYTRFQKIKNEIKKTIPALNPILKKKIFFFKKFESKIMFW